MPNAEIIDEKDARLAGIEPDTSDAAIAARARAELEALGGLLMEHEERYRVTQDGLIKRVEAGEITFDEAEQVLEPLHKSMKTVMAQYEVAKNIATGLSTD